jgi:hypothetical protein
MALQKASTPAIQYIPSSAGSIYANPAGAKSFVKGLQIFNANTTSEIVKIHVVPNSSGSPGTASAANQIGQLSIASGATVWFPLGIDGWPLVLGGTNDSIQAQTTTASKVTVLVHRDLE